MRKILNITLAMLLTAGIYSCKEQYTTYQDAEYVMFADTLTTNMVLNDGSSFTVPVASTVACDYDRTFGVEIIDKGSNAIEGRHYRLKSNTVTIPAGERTANVEVFGNYDKIEAADSLGFIMQLVLPEQLKWDLYSDYNRTKVVMYKSCPFDINDFGGTKEKPRYCIVTSLLLYNYPGTNTDYQRLVRTYKHPSRENAIIVEDMFYDGYDVTIDFKTGNPAEPAISLDADQVISDEASVFGQILGDNKILGDDSPHYTSYYNSCQKFAILYLHVYVHNLTINVGTVGHYYNVLEWISDEEADAMMKDGY